MKKDQTGAGTLTEPTKPTPQNIERFRGNLRDLSLAVLAIVALGFVLWWLKAILVPLTLAAAAYFLVLPALGWMRKRWKIPRWAGILTLFLAAGLVLTLVTMLVFQSVRNIGDDLATYRESLVTMAGHMDAWFQEREFPYATSQWREAARSLPLLDWARQLTGDVFSILATAALTLVFIVFLLGDTKPRQKLEPEKHEISMVVSRYLAAKTAASLLTGLGTAIVLTILDVDLAVFFGFAAFLLNFVPYLGSAVALGLPLPVALLQDGGGPGSVLAVLGFPFLVQYTVANLIEPRMMGRVLGLNNLVVLVGLLFWGVLWGAPGVFMATPILSVGKLILERTVPGGKFWDLFSLRTNPPSLAKATQRKRQTKKKAAKRRRN